MRQNVCTANWSKVTSLFTHHETPQHFVSFLSGIVAEKYWCNKKRELQWFLQPSWDILRSIFYDASQGPHWCKPKRSSFYLKHYEFFFYLMFWWVTCRREAQPIKQYPAILGQDQLHIMLSFFFFGPGDQCTVYPCSLMSSLLRPLVDVHPHMPLQKHINSCNSCFYSCSAVLFLCFDWQVYDGENTSSRLLGNFTRDVMVGHVINSTSNRLWLEFNSNASGTNQGFRLTYTSELFEKLTWDQLIRDSCFSSVFTVSAMVYSSIAKRTKASLSYGLTHIFFCAQTHTHKE